MIINTWSIFKIHQFFQSSFTECFLSKIWSRISNLHWLSYPSSLWWYRTALVSLCPSRHWYFWRVQAIFVESSRILICLMFPHDKYRPCTFFVRKVTFMELTLITWFKSCLTDFSIIKILFSPLVLANSVVGIYFNVI